MADTTLYSERQSFPWQFAAWFLLGVGVLCLVLFLVTGLSFADDWWLLPVGIALAGGWIPWVWIACRVSTIRVDERRLEIPWRPGIPLDKIETARIVEGDELKRIRRLLSRGIGTLPAGTAAATVPGVGLAGLNLAQASLVLRMRNDPVIRGLAAWPETRSAIYLETDASVGPTRSWLVGTKNPRELDDVLHKAIESAKSRGARAGSLSEV